MSKWSEVEEQLNLMVNQWYHTAEIKRMLGVPLTPARLAFRHQHMNFFSNDPFLHPSPSRERKSEHRERR